MINKIQFTFGLLCLNSYNTVFLSRIKKGDKPDKFVSFEIHNFDQL